MKAKKAIKGFKKYLKRKAIVLEKIRIPEQINIMLGFYTEIRAHGCDVDEDADMLLFQWGVHDWGDGEFFEYDLTRQFLIQKGSEDSVWQLSLTLKFNPDKGLRKIEAGNKWCSKPDEVSTFKEFINEHDSTKALIDLEPSSVTLFYKQQ